MFVHANVTRLVFYGILVYAAAIGDIPWWVVPAVVCYDNMAFVLFKVPFTKLPKLHPEKPFDWNNYKGPNQ